MNDLREIVKSKNFVVNEFIIKNINKLDLSLNEFLLILYFLNCSNTFDTSDIQKRIGIDQSISLEVFNNLIKKNLIEVKVKKGKTIEEEISLDLFYNKLLLNKEEKEINNDIFTSFEKEFGRTLSPIEYETINNWLENKVTEEMILKALKEAVLNGVTNLRYIDKIIYEWNKKESKTKEDKKEELFDYNWLDDDNE